MRGEQQASCHKGWFGAQGLSPQGSCWVRHSGSRATPPGDSLPLRPPRRPTTTHQVLSKCSFRCGLRCHFRVVCDPTRPIFDIHFLTPTLLQQRGSGVGWEYRGYRYFGGSLRESRVL